MDESFPLKYFLMRIVFPDYVEVEIGNILAIFKTNNEKLL